MLDEDPDGFFLMIEGGAGDWANHGNQKGRLIEEQVAFDEAVDSVIDWVESDSSWSETLLIVTADHESGYLTGPGSGQFSSGPVWKPIGMAGAGSMPGMQFNSTGHTNQLVPLFARGAGSELLSAAAIRTDIVRGAYCDNTDVGKTLHAVLRP